MQFDEKLKLLVNSKYKSIGDFAEKVEVNYTQVSQYLNGRKVSIEFLNKVIEEFPEADLNWLLKNSDELQIGVQEATELYQKELNALQLVNKISTLLAELKKKLPQK